MGIWSNGAETGRMSGLWYWTTRPRPERRIFEGQYVRLEPLDVQRHGEGLYAASSMEDADLRFRYLPDEVPSSQEEFAPWLARAAASEDPMFFAVIDRTSGRIAGRQTLMRIDPANGVAEIGNILWSSIMARRPAATEAFFLFAHHVFDDLGYRRFEWKCDNLNLPSKKAALRFGFQFEGIFRQHLVVKGRSRDTAWFSMIDSEWPAARRAFETWLDPSNFDAKGKQINRLTQLREKMLSER